MIVTKQIAAYLQHEITHEQLVDWAEEVMMNGEFPDEEFTAVRDVVSRLGVADVRAFGLTWEDCEQLLQRLGFTARVEVVSA